LRQLQKQPADLRHVILLTDADEITGSPSEYIDLVAYMRNEAKIRVSAVGIGRGVSESFVKRIATYGNGVYHLATNLAELPQIVFEVIGQKAPEVKRQEKDYVPALARGSEILAGLPERSFPPLKGYIESELKKGARMELMLPHDGTISPLLASWRYGKGRSAVFTSDQGGRWSKEWIAWGGLERFWGKVFDWLGPERERLPPHEVRINLVDDHPVLDFYLYSQEFDGNVFRYSYSRAEGSKGEGTLNRLAPGHYQSKLPFASPGDYRIELREERRGRVVGYPVAGFTLPVKAKDDVYQDGFNLRLLQQIAQSTGGSINFRPEQEPRTGHTAAKVTFFRPYFIFLAAVLFLLEVFFRRFFIREI
ncbi:MAG: glutamine amidotransferase, partial [Candidatus Binatia bacterium]